MTKVLANDGISQSGIDTLEAAGFEVITQKVAQEQLANVINEKNINVLLVRSCHFNASIDQFKAINSMTKIKSV